MQDSSPFFCANFAVGFQIFMAAKLTVKEVTMITSSEDRAQVPPIKNNTRGMSEFGDHFSHFLHIKLCGFTKFHAV